MKPAQPLDLALIGNCRMGALINREARIVWCCFPRFDGDPVFSRLLSGDVEKGFTDVVLADRVDAKAEYARNTPVLETILTDANGGAVRIVDFMPRFAKFERMFRPPQLIRRIEPIAGRPRVAIRVRPTFDYGRDATTTVMGSNHIRYVGTTEVLRLSTDAPLSYLTNETTFALTRPLTLIFGSDEPFVTEIESTALDFENRTRNYWLGWVRSLGIPFEWQDQTIRAAITLKLCSFDETGAIIAAHTTSIPEAPNTTRNWDYRFCWLRDAYYVVNALNRLGATQTMENFLNYLTTVVTEDTQSLQPLHSIIPGQPLEELHADYLDGFLGHGPVRIGNAASVQAQHDGYGSVILAAKQLFVDRRLPKMGDLALYRMLEPLGERAYALALTPDAGIWEYRGREQVHTYSAALCWAACDRLAQIAGILGLHDRRAYWGDRARKLRETILERAWNEKIGAFVGAFGHKELDASVLMIGELGLVSADDPRFARTTEVIGRELQRDGRIMRYTAPDDFGAPETAFLVCNFWYIDALAALGRRDEAREMFSELLSKTNSFGLLSEDLRTEDNTLWGNIPQTYSMAGIINSAMRLSTRWEDAWCRASS